MTINSYDIGIRSGLNTIGWQFINICTHLLLSYCSFRIVQLCGRLFELLYYCSVGILGGGHGGSGPQSFSPELYSGWLFSPPLFMVVEVLQGTELKLRAWMTSWYEVLVWLCLAWCGCAGPSVVVWLWCVPSRLGIISRLGVG